MKRHVTQIMSGHAEAIVTKLTGKLVPLTFQIFSSSVFVCPSVCNSFLSLSSLQTDQCIQVFRNCRNILYTCLLLSLFFFFFLSSLLKPLLLPSFLVGLVAFFLREK